MTSGAASNSGPAKTTSRLICVDLLRGLAALFVVLYHAQGFFRRTPVATIWNGGIYDLFVEPIQQLVAYLLFGFGFLGVPLFFIISGFCIHLPFAAPDTVANKPLKIRTFAPRRFLRLYPAYAVTCLAGFVLAVARSGLGEDVATWSNLAGHLAFWHYDFPFATHGAELTIVLWSIVVEVHFYILYAILFTGLRRLGIGRATLLAVLIGIGYRLIWALEGMDGADTLAFFEPHRFALARFGEWMLGAWIAECYVRGDFEPGKLNVVRASSFLGWTGVWLGLAAVGLSLLVTALFSASQYTSEVPVTIGFAWVIASLLSLERSDRLKLGKRFRAGATWLGDRSYSLYLIHYLVISVVGEFYVRVMGIADKDALGGSIAWFGVTIAAITAALIAADVMYRVIERPTHGWARKVGKKPAPAAV
jgi:peptidoglycan/LPS O-acetylase OafA/YrhL